MPHYNILLSSQSNFHIYSKLLAIAINFVNLLASFIDIFKK